MKLLNYIQGLRKGKEAHRLEKESMKDPFLADALDGFRQAEGKNHASRIEQIQKQIATRASQTRRTTIWRWSAAACLLMAIGMGSYFLWFLQNDTELKEMSTLTENVPTPQTESAPTSRNKKDTAQIILPKQDNRRDVVAKIQTPPPDNKSVAVVQDTKPSQLMPQRDKIAGKVIDENGEPISGAYIHYKDTDIGTISNLDGEFKLEKNDSNKELTARFIGYKEVNMPVDTNKNMLIAMNAEESMLSEIVVVGYGTLKKTTPTAASTRANVELDTTHNAKPTPVIGKKAFKKYLKKNLIRPTDETCKGCKGKVVVTFFIDSNGSPQNISITKSLCQSADKEAIRLIKEGPKWTISHLPVTVKIKF